MSKDTESQTALAVFLMVFGAALPLLGIASWDQALDFDPCANIFAKPGQCITSGLSFAGGGAFLIIMGVTLVGSATSRKRTEKVGLGAVLAIVWLGLWMVVIGAAMIFAGLSLP